MRFIKGFANYLPLIVSMLPIVFVILIIVLIVLCIKNKVKIKWRTFKGKGFRPVRGNFGLYVYCGKQGTGKTYSVVEYLQDNKNDIVVFCNIADIQGFDYFHFTGFNELLALKEILDYDYINHTDNEFKTFIFSKKFDKERTEQIFSLLQDYRENDKQLVFVYDEIFTELLKGSKLGKQVIDFLCQMRKRKIIFLTTCQEWAELPLSFRRFCRFEIDCQMRPFLGTGFLIKTFKDAENMKWSNDDQEHVAPLVETTITKCRQSIANSYNTFLRISSVAVPELPGASTTQPGNDT